MDTSPLPYILLSTALGKLLLISSRNCSCCNLRRFLLFLSTTENLFLYLPGSPVPAGRMGAVRLLCTSTSCLLLPSCQTSCSPSPTLFGSCKKECWTSLHMDFSIRWGYCWPHTPPRTNQPVPLLVACKVTCPSWLSPAINLHSLKNLFCRVDVQVFALQVNQATTKGG